MKNFAQISVFFSLICICNAILFAAAPTKKSQETHAKISLNAKAASVQSSITHSATSEKTEKEKASAETQDFQELKKLFDKYPKNANLWEVTFEGKEKFLAELDNSPQLKSAMATRQASEYFTRLALKYDLTQAFVARGWKPLGIQELF